MPVQKIDPQKNVPTYDSGGRAPLSKEPVRRVTVSIDEKLLSDLEKVSEKFINPSTLKPYGISAIARYCLLIGIETIDSVKEVDLLYYIENPDKPKGRVGRRSVSKEKVRITLLVPLTTIKKINKHLATLESDIIGTTTYIRFFMKKYLKSVTISNLYESMPKKHKKIMEDKGFNSRILQNIYKNSR